MTEAGIELIVAAQYNKIKRVQKILNQGIVDINYQDSNGVAVIHHAVMYSKWKTIKFLLSHKNLLVTVRTKEEGFTLLHLAFKKVDNIYYDDEEIEIEKVEDQGNDQKSEQNEDQKENITENVETEQENEDQMENKDDCSEKEEEVEEEEHEDEDEEEEEEEHHQYDNDYDYEENLIRILIEIIEGLIVREKSLITIPDKSGQLPIHFVHKACNEDVLKLLLENGADLNVLDNKGRNCLHHAAVARQFKAIEFLLNNTSIDPEIKDNDGRNALSLFLISEEKDRFEYRPKIISLIDNAVGRDPETGAYKFEDFFPITKLACTHRYKFLYECDYMIRKFYSENNSKFKIFEEIESRVPCYSHRYLIYAFLHDKVTVADIEEIIHSKKFIKSYEEFLKMALTEEKCCSTILELFEYLDSKVHNRIHSLEGFDFCEKVGTYLMSQHYNCSSNCTRQVLKFFNQKQFDINNTLKRLIEESFRFNGRLFEKLTRFAPLIIPFTTNLFEVVSDLHNKHDQAQSQFCLSKSPQQKYLPNLLKNYADCAKLAKTFEYKSHVFTLKRICRDSYRRNLLEQTKSNFEFLTELDKLKDQVPKELFNYLKLENRFYNKV